MPAQQFACPLQAIRQHPLQLPPERDTGAVWGTCSLLTQELALSQAGGDGTSQHLSVHKARKPHHYHSASLSLWLLPQDLPISAVHHPSHFTFLQGFPEQTHSSQLLHWSSMALCQVTGVTGTAALVAAGCSNETRISSLSR